MTVSCFRVIGSRFCVVAAFAAVVQTQKEGGPIHRQPSWLIST